MECDADRVALVPLADEPGSHALQHVLGHVPGVDRSSRPDLDRKCGRVALIAALVLPGIVAIICELVPRVVVDRAVPGDAWGGVPTFNPARQARPSGSGGPDRTRRNLLEVGLAFALGEAADQ